MKPRTKRGPRPILSFRAYPARGRLFYSVHVFRTLRDLRAYGHMCNPALRSRMAGACRPWTRITVARDRSQTTHPELGEILLTAARLQASIVGHECMHAALAWARRKRIDVDRCMPEEERACYALSALCRTIYVRCDAANLLG